MHIGLGLQVGSIPAWAGEPVWIFGRCLRQPVYPRVGGGTVKEPLTDMIAQGLSPRGRGNPQYPPPLGSRMRSIPAWAGEPGRPRGIFSKATVYPRVGGGTLMDRQAIGAEGGLSPRGRGNLQCACPVPLLWGSIPAWAGEPRRRSNQRYPHWVYPRVGGGTPSGSSKAVDAVYPRVGGGTILSLGLDSSW